MALPKADPPRCDVPGCGMFAVKSTDGTEVDVQDLDRPAEVGINVCERHDNWPHSTDAKLFALSPAFQARKARV
jgi:hypothetical protein